MQTQQRRFSWESLQGRVRAAAFFTLYYLYVWLRFQPHLIYHGRGMTIEFPIFSRGLFFFKKFLGYPGGLVAYLSAYVSQYYYYSWVGALIITAVAWLLYLATGRYLRAFGGRRFPILPFIPAVLLLILYNQYSHQLAIVMGLLTALGFVSLYVSLPASRSLVRLALYVVLSVPLYYAAGGAYLFFALLCGIYELMTKRRLLVGLVCVLSALALPYAMGVYILGVPMANAYARLLPFQIDPRPAYMHVDPKVLALVFSLYLFLPLVALAVGFRQRLASLVAVLWRGLWRGMLWLGAAFWAKEGAGRRVAGDSTGFPKGARLVEQLQESKFKGVLESLVLLVIAALVVHLSFSKGIKETLLVEYYVCHKMWPQVLEEARRVPPNRYDFIVKWDVNRALYHTGRLPYEMFSYQQHPAALVPLWGPPVTTPSLVDMRMSDVFFELGSINEAERAACEAMAPLGQRPLILQQLAKIYILKGELGAGRICLGALTRDLMYGNWARHTLRQLDDDPLLSADEELEHIRSVMMRKDYIFDFSPETTLLKLLEQNRRNRMVFEYLMAYYLLTKELDNFVENIPRLHDFDYPDIPTHYQEAILVYQEQTGKTVPLPERRITLQTLERYRDFSQLLERYRSGDQSARDALHQEHGNSYFFYSLFGP